ncbi:hypothetical protein DL767_006291 [Monosporascus sp. MG133]|nr:hypothetical protein DL767_006291 [Monosporascus sp. MG133]
MKIASIQAALGSAVVLLSTPTVATVQHRHRHLHQKLAHAHSSSSYNQKYSARNTTELEKRSNKACPFPQDKGLVAVTPEAKNAGWAMAPDQECVEGTWCPIACPPGQVMNQWKPQTTYAFPESTFGGLYCGEGGTLEFPFKDEPCCVDGTGAVDVVNKCGDVVSFCQTVLPGYEDMIIPTDVYDTATIAVPDNKYWAGTAAHYYINAPGVDSSKGCIWGDSSTPIGNWSPYVAGANTVSGGTTFVKVGLNPVWEESALSSTKPDFGLEIECPDGGCTGLPCRVDGSGVLHRSGINDIHANSLFDAYYNQYSHSHSHFYFYFYFYVKFFSITHSVFDDHVDDFDGIDDFDDTGDFDDIINFIVDSVVNVDLIDTYNVFVDKLIRDYVIRIHLVDEQQQERLVHFLGRNLSRKQNYDLVWLD